MPRYQREKDREVEEQFIDMASIEGFRGELTPDVYPWDVNLYEGERLAWIVEVKRRAKRYGTLNIDKSKIDRLEAHAALLGAAPMLVIKWGDTGFWYTVCQTWSYEVGVIQREEPRGYEGETFDEPDDCYKIPAGDFTQLFYGQTAKH
jgi:Holliday junction resolvase